MASTSKITLKSSDGQTFEVEEAVAVQSRVIKPMIEDADSVILLPIDDGIRLFNVTGKILSKVVEYCKQHVDADADKDKAVDDELKASDAQFVKVDQNTLFGLFEAANYLDIPSLLGLAAWTVADMIKGKTPEEIRKTFNIKNDFTPEEEKEIEKENQWKKVRPFDYLN
ncbi:hypothetical protein SLA2020_372240 [Shorea laevis]